MKKEPNKKVNLTKEQWLAKSLEILTQRGPGVLRIDNITKSMNVTKCSFYWHFEDRQDYILNLAEYWAWMSTGQVIETMKSVSGDTTAKFEKLITHII